MAKSPGRSPAHQLVLARRATVPVPRLTNWSDSRGNRPRSRPPTPTRKIAQVPRTAVPTHQLVSIHFPGPQTWGPSRLSSRQLVSLTGPAGRPRPRTPTPHDHFLFHHPGRPHTHANWSDTERPAVPPSQCPPTGLTHRSRVPTVPPTGLTLGGRPCPPSQNPSFSWPTGLRARSPARSLAVSLPRSRPTGPISPGPTVRPAVKRWPTGLVLAENCQSPKFFFPAGRWPAWLGQLVGRVWVWVVGRASFLGGFPRKRRPPAR